MNNIILKGKINNIQHSHTINGISYDSAYLLVNNSNDLIELKFKSGVYPYKNGDVICIDGNIRSYSHQLNNKNKVDIYVFTKFDDPFMNGEDLDIFNAFEVDGRICKKNPIRTFKNGTKNIQFILANNIINSDLDIKINNYLPCIAWGNLAELLNQLSVNDIVNVKGELHFRTYKKYINEKEFELHHAYELLIKNFEWL